VIATAAAPSAKIGKGTSVGLSIITTARTAANVVTNGTPGQTGNPMI
jgi:hypothetical protein